MSIVALPRRLAIVSALPALPGWFAVSDAAISLGSVESAALTSIVEASVPVKKGVAVAALPFRS